MSEFTATQIAKPVNEQDFERACEVLARCILKDPNAQLHGRRGQRQHGVDIFGRRDRRSNRVVGVQCKLKGVGKSLSEKEVKAEVEKALTFEPLLSEFIIVTTAPDDAKLQRLALELSASSSENRDAPLKIQVLGWESLEREIHRHAEARKAFDPSHTAHGDRMEARMEQQFSAIRNEFAKLGPDTTVIAEQVNSAAEREINRYVKSIPTDPKQALDLFQGLQDDLDESASGRVRFRVAANIASCQLELGETETAARGLIAACDLDPKNPKAIANKAYGLLLLEDLAALRAFAEAHMPKHPDSEVLAACYIHGLVADESVVDPLARVPEAARSAEEVVTAHVQWLMKRGAPGVWRDAAIAAHEERPDNDRLAAFAACARLERAIGGNFASFAKRFTEDERADLDAAIGIFETLWPKLRDGPPHARRDRESVPINLMAALRFRGRIRDEIQVGEEALESFPGDATLAKRLLNALVAADDTDRARELLDSLDIDEGTIAARLEIAQTDEDWGAIRALIPAHLEYVSEENRNVARAARAIADAALAPPEERRAILEAALEGFRDDARAAILLGRGARRHGFADFADSCFETGRQAVRDGDDAYEARVAVAGEAMAREEPNVAADLLMDRVPTDRDGEGPRLLTAALANEYPVRERALRFLEALPPEVRRLPYYRRAEGIVHLNRGAPRDAIEPLRHAFERERTVENFLSLTHARYRAGDRKSVAESLDDGEIDALPGSARARIDLSRILSDFGHRERALDLGYAALTEGQDDPQVNFGFFSLIIKSTLVDFSLDCDTVQRGVWARFTRGATEAHEVLVGEEAHRPWGEKADPDANAFVAAARGLRVGEKFEHRNPTTGADETWTVAEIKPRWLQAFHYIMEHFGQRFPDTPGIAAIHMAEDDIQPVLDHIRRWSGTRREQANLYLRKRIPIAFAAGKGRQQHSVRQRIFLKWTKDLRICQGTPEERAQALRLVESHGRAGAVLDALTAWRAARFDILPVLQERLGRLAIPASEVSQIHALAEEPFGEDNRESMTLDYRDGKFVREVFTPEQEGRKGAPRSGRRSRKSRRLAMWSRWLSPTNFPNWARGFSVCRRRRR